MSDLRVGPNYWEMPASVRGQTTLREKFCQALLASTANQVDLQSR
jgi:hypothetical protein